MDDPIFAPAHDLATAIWRSEVTSSEVVDAHLAHIERHNPRLGAIVTLDEEGARAGAREADAALDRGEVFAPFTECP